MRCSSSGHELSPGLRDVGRFALKSDLANGLQFSREYIASYSYKKELLNVIRRGIHVSEKK